MINCEWVHGGDFADANALELRYCGSWSFRPRRIKESFLSFPFLWDIFHSSNNLRDLVKVFNFLSHQLVNCANRLTPWFRRLCESWSTRCGCTPFIHLSRGPVKTVSLYRGLFTSSKGLPLVLKVAWARYDFQGLTSPLKRLELVAKRSHGSISLYD